ncbi:MAG: radical SAM family heme chaperone HemW [Oscillospiraceae bacterium]|jgi:oxygen-independent coproporphyrinogen-3 oxidase|nr:radical SAM family heme chaperone HemW [Oscillospiraceae bacterium]
MEKTLGIYIHVPFCASKCAYCDFYSAAGSDGLMPGYDAALRRHIREYAPQLDGYLVDSVYFGGGTPSYYGAPRLISALNALKKHSHILLDAEITVEMNPDSASKGDLQLLRRAGVNRVSLGVQSASEKHLKNLGRRHTFAQAEEAVKNARAAGFRNISIDLMYGLPSQTRDDWAETLGRAAALKAEHISGYSLKLEEGTPLYIFKGTPFLPDDDQQADMYLYMVETLSRFGYRQYEISNFARRGFESRHNLKYWLGEEYLGFGPAAHSYIGGVRYSAASDTRRYIENIAAGNSVVEMEEEIAGFELAGEYLMLRLRTTHGISEQEYHAIYHCGMDYILELLRSYEKHGWAVCRDGRWRFTPQGFLLSNTLIGDLLDAQTKQRTETVRPWQKLPAEERQTTLFSSEKHALPL